MNFRKLPVLLASLLLCGVTLTAAPSPWDSWRAGYSNFEKGESLRERGRYSEALRAFERARSNYLAVRSARPDWNQRVIADRLRDCERQITEIRRLLEEAAKNMPPSTPPPKPRPPAVKPRPVPSPGPAPVKPTPTPVTPTPTPVIQPIAMSTGISEEEAEKLRKEIAALKQENERLRNSVQAQRNFESEIASLLRDRRMSEEKYALLEKRYKSLETESKKPDARIALLEQQILDERMNGERLAKQLAAAEKQSALDRESARRGTLAKNALENQLKKRDEELRRIQAALKSAEEIDRLLTDARAENRVLTEKTARLERELEAAKDREGIAARSRAEGEKMLKQQSAAEIGRLRNEIAAMQKRISDLIADRDALAGKLSVADQGAQKSAAEIDRLLAGARTENRLLTEKVARLEKDLAASKDRELTAVQSRESGENVLKQQSAAEIKRLKDEIAAMQKRISGLIADRDRLAADLRRSKSLGETLESEKRMLGIDLEQARNAAKLGAADLASLREKNRSLEEDVKTLYDKAADLEKRLAARNSADFQAAAAARKSVRQLESDLLAAHNELVTLRAGLDKARGALDEADRKFKALGAEKEQLRNELLDAANREKALQQEVNALRAIRVQFDKLQRDFHALAAENRENRLLVEAAKPRQAELERAKLRLLDNDRLKAELAREQQQNAELRAAYTADQQELTRLRRRAEEFEESRRRMAELEAVAKEAKRLRELDRELAALRALEPELAALKIKFGESESALRNANAILSGKNEEIGRLKSETAALHKRNEEMEKLRKRNGELDAMLASRHAEVERLNAEVTRLNAAMGQLNDAIRRKSTEDVHISCRMEAEKLRREVADLRRETESLRQTAAESLRQTAAAVNPLNDRIRKLHAEMDALRRTLAQANEANREQGRAITLRDGEIVRLRRLNTELADYRKKSALELQNKVDASRLTRLEDEIAELNKLNAEITAERDKLAALLESRVKESAAAGQGGSESAPLKSDRSAEDLAAAGLVAEQDGKSELAIWHYRQAVVNKPDFVPAHLRLGMLLFRRGSYAEAVPHLEAAYRADPGDLRLALAAARSCIAVSRFGNAKNIIDPLLKKFPENAEVQLCAALIEAGCGAPARAEERMHAAARLAPESAEIMLELARLLTASVTDRRSEAVLAYERSRALGGAPDPGLETALGQMLDNRRDLMKFMRDAAREAELNGDWGSAVWYYKKILDDKHPEVVPLLAFSQWKSGDPSAARESLEFNAPSRAGMVVRMLIALSEKDNETAIRSAQQSAGALIPADWVGFNMELEKLKKTPDLPPAVNVLLKSIRRR